MGFFNALAADKSMYDQLYAVDNKDGKVKFQWDKLDNLFENAGNSAIAQAQRTFQSTNLTELGQNYLSGAELLKNLPGKLGEDFRTENTSSRIATGVLGFMLEVALDPTAMVGKAGRVVSEVAENGSRVSRVVSNGGRVNNALAARGISEVGLYAAGGGLASGLTRAIGGGERAQDIARRVGGNIAIGNVFAGPTVIAAREVVRSTVGFATRIAQDATRGSAQKTAANLLDFFVGPTASATSDAKRAFVKAIALQEELPRTINTAAEAQQAMLARLPKKERKKAEKLFSELAVLTTDEKGWGETLGKLSEMGVDPHAAENVVSTYQLGVLRMIDVLQQGGNAELVERLSLKPNHLRQTYRLNMGGKIETDHLDYLTRINTPASFELGSTGILRQRLSHLLDGGAPNSAEFFTMRGNPFWTERSAVNGIKATDKGVTGPRLLNDADKFGVKPSTLNSVSQNVERPKFVPLSLLENNNLKGVDLEKAARFGIRDMPKKPGTFITDASLNPTPVPTRSGVLAGLATVKTDFPRNPLETRVERAGITPGPSLEPTSRMPNGFRRISIHNGDDVEEAKLALTAARKELIATGALDSAVTTVGSHLVTDQRGYLYAATDDGTVTSWVTKNPDGGVEIVPVDEAYDTISSGENVLRETLQLRQADEALNPQMLAPGEKAVSQAYDNLPAFTDVPAVRGGQPLPEFHGFERPALTKTTFDQPTLPGQNTLPRFAPSNAERLTTTRVGKDVPRIQGGRNEATQQSGDFITNAAARGASPEFRVPVNEAVKPGFNVSRNPFGKTQMEPGKPASARILPPEKVEQFMTELGEHLDGLRDKGNNVVGRYESLTHGGTIKKTIDGQEAEVKVNAQEYWKHLREQKKDQTVGDLIEFALKWGETEQLPDSLRKQLAGYVAEAVTYVPGSREFAMGVKHLREGTPEWDELSNYMGDAFQQVEGRHGKNLKERVLPEAFNHLYGKVDEFSVRALDQANALSETVARTTLINEMKSAGVLTENPFPGAVLMRERLSAEEVKILGLEDFVDRDWWINPGNLAAMKNSFNAVRLNGPVERALQPLSNAFRRAALITDVSAHATQMLGNLAMLSHMGYGPLFDDPRRAVGGFKRAFHSVTQMDDRYQEMVNSGLQITMSPLSEGQRALMAERVLIRQDSRPETLKDAIQEIHSSWNALWNVPADAVTRVGQRVEDFATRQTQRVVNTFKREGQLDYVDARQQITQVKPGVMFGLHDMLTRAYVWDQVVRKETGDLANANPWLLNFVDQQGLVDTAALRKKLDGVKQLQEAVASGRQGSLEPAALAEMQTFQKALKAADADLDDVDMVLSELDAAKLRAAEVGNEVALNYFEVPRMVRFATQSGIVPFIKFQWKATGRMAEWLDEKPWQFAPYYKAAYNGNQAFSDNPEQWMQQQQSLPQHVRNALVVPTGTKDAHGRPEYLDLSRWVPFGMFAGAAGGAVNVDGSPMPNQLISAPLVELALMAHTGEDAQGQPLVAEGQSKVAAVASKMALFFSPSGVGPGGRRAQQLANALEQSKFVVDENGSPMYSNPLMNAAKLYGELPAEVGAYIGKAFGDEGSARGARNMPDPARPWTTPEQAISRAIVPGLSVSGDTQKAYGQIDQAFGHRISEVEKQRNTILNSATYQMSPQQFAGKLEQYEGQIVSLQQARYKQLQRLVIGSE